MSRSIWRLFSRTEWSRRLLGYRRLKAEGDRRLLIVQVDGLSRPEFEFALKKGKMPFLRKLIALGDHKLMSHYSGLPSITPAVQAEVFYGARCAVPGFVYYDRRTDTEQYMLNSTCAASVETGLSRESAGLMQEGSSYSNIFTGGAAESHFCAASLGWKNFSERSSILVFLGLLILHLDEFIRILCLALVELWVALWDAATGLRDGLRAQLRQIPRRVAVCSVLRDWCTLSARIDMTRGLPVVHVNYLGYDEQSHRRGPHSRYAHWTLTGIDRCIRKLFRTARRGDGQSYQVWIYSDHGQESTTPYEDLAGRNIDETVREILGDLDVPIRSAAPKRGIETERAAWLKRPKIEQPLEIQAVQHEIRIAAKGPICHIYLPESLDDDRRERVAQALCERGRVPMVVTRLGADAAKVRTAGGTFILPQDAAKVFGERHPFCQEATQDFIRLIHHHNAGDLMLTGYVVGGKNHVTFAHEYGSHAGPGVNETHGFVLVPPWATNQVEDKQYVRPNSLRALIVKTCRSSSRQRVNTDLLSQ